MKNWLLRGISRGSEDYTQVLILKFCPDHMTKPEGLHLKICDNTIFLWELIDELCELSKSMVLDLWCTLGSPKELLAEKAVATHSSTLAWKIPRTEEPGRLQSMGSLRVGHDWVTSLSLFTFLHWRRKWQPTRVFLPGESQGRGSLMGCLLWGCTESDTTEAT